MPITVTLIDTACMLLDINGFRILTDPVFDEPGQIYHFAMGSASKKYSKPALQPEQIGKVDLILLSHDHHQDNFDTSGRAYAATIETVLSTKAAERRVKGVTGLEEWNSLTIHDARLPGGQLTITAVPAQHTCLKVLNPIAGKVIGFVLEWPGQNGVYYISGDTVYFKGIEQIAERFPQIDVAFLHCGAAGFPYLTGPVYYTFTSTEVVKAVERLKPHTVVPVHTSGWWHFRESESHAKAEYASSGIGERMQWLTPGKAFQIG